MENIGLRSSVNSDIALKQQNKDRIRHAHKKVMDKYKKRRQALRSIRKHNKKGKIAYIPGGFSINIDPDVDFSVDKCDKIQKNVVKAGTVKDVDITFISDDDVIMIKAYTST